MNQLYLEPEKLKKESDPEAFATQLFASRSNRFQIVLTYTSCLVGFAHAPHLDGRGSWVIWLGPLGIVWISA